MSNKTSNTTSRVVERDSESRIQTSNDIGAKPIENKIMTRRPREAITRQLDLSSKTNKRALDPTNYDNNNNDVHNLEDSYPRKARLIEHDTQDNQDDSMPNKTSITTPRVQNSTTNTPVSQSVPKAIRKEQARLYMEKLCPYDADGNIDYRGIYSRPRGGR